MNSRLIWLFAGVTFFFSLTLAMISLLDVADSLDERLFLALVDIQPILCALVAIIGLSMAVRSLDDWDLPRVAWLLLLIGIVLFFLAESVYGWLDVIMGNDMDELFPSIADAFWMVGYVPLVAGMFAMLVGYLRGGFPRGKWQFYLVLGLVYLAVVGGLSMFLFEPIITSEDTETLVKLVAVAYPIMDLMLLAPALILAYITTLLGGGRLSRPWRFICIGFIFLTMSDIVYCYLEGMESEGHGFLDIGWNLSYLFIAMGGVLQHGLFSSHEERGSDE